MNTLELAIPPPIVMLVVGCFMWLLSFLFPAFTLPSFSSLLVAIIFSVIGFLIGLLGIITFIRVGTTADPRKFTQVSALVTSSIYRITRNPMYLGILLMLIAWAIFLGNLLALLCAFIFIPYINRYQIKPEERLLEDKFGTAFIAYKAKVRRWL